MLFQFLFLHFALYGIELVREVETSLFLCKEVKTWKSERDRKVLFFYTYFKKKGKHMATIISACISAAVTLLVCLISNHGQQEKTRALMEYKLNELTKRDDKHYNTIDRTYHLEEQMALQEEKMKVANHRISDLEERVN